MKRKILVVDDEAKIVDLMRLYLERDGYQVLSAADGQGALEQARRYSPDLVLLDLNLPDIDGREVCRSLRLHSDIPIIMLTARDEDMDKILGLELGADDYITKPFSPREVVARVRAVLRRAGSEPSVTERIVIGELVIDLARHEARYRDKALDLSPTEFGLLQALAETPGRVYTRMQLLDKVQGTAYEGYERTIDAHIKNLRRKMAAVDPDAAGLVATVRGVGYRFESGDHA